jgi:FemAB-related protein (PEP-CTERM system-associated)
MTFRQLNQNDIATYQSFIHEHPKTTPYHNMAWSNAVSEAYGFTPLFFGLFSNSELVAVLPAVIVKALSGKKKLCSLPYCDLGGILALSKDAMISMKQHVLDYANSNGMVLEYRDCETNQNYFTQDSSLEENSEEETRVLEPGEKVRMLYQLHNSVEEQLASFKPKLRSQIKKSIKNGVTAEIVSLPDSQKIDEFYQVFAANMRELGSPVHSIEWFKSIFSHYQENAFLVLVKYEDACVGGGIVIHTHNKAVIPWASTLRSHNKYAPNMLLYWEVLSEVINRGIHNFDFGRSGFNEGTYRFKKQWGALPIPLTWEVSDQGKLSKELTSEKSPARDTLENVWQKLPLKLTILLGSKIRKYISL